jgi:hypothetical protein
VAFPAGVTSGLSEAQNPMQTSKLLKRFLKKNFGYVVFFFGGGA